MLSLSSLFNPISISSSILSHKPHHFFNGTPLPSNSLTYPATKPLLTKLKPNSTSPTNFTIQEQQEEEDDDDDFRVLTATTSEYNKIVIVETQNSKVLFLDDSGNVHSILCKDQKWTKSYWDEFSTLPAIIPPGPPVAIFGLGGGTVAHQLLDTWPSLEVDGWELDGVLIDRAREFFDLSSLEKGNESGGILRVCVGDALSCGGGDQYAGIVVDLFSDARVLPQLEEVETWVEMREKLMPNGRIMVNCGGGVLGEERGWEGNLVIRAMCQAFGGDYVCWKKMPENESGNYLALTGGLPDLITWSGSVPEKFSSAVQLWRPCGPLS